MDESNAIKFVTAESMGGKLVIGRAVSKHRVELKSPFSPSGCEVLHYRVSRSLNDDSSPHANAKVVPSNKDRLLQTLDGVFKVSKSA